MDITKFLGVRYSLTGSTSLEVGELSDMKNMRITADYKVRKREGYKKVIEVIGPIRAQWSGTIDGDYFDIFVSDGHIYNRVEDVKTDIGVITDAPTTVFYFGEKLYFLNGTEYKSFDGTTLADVSGYIPLIAIGTPPTGGGTDYEKINLLNGKRRQRFSADGTETEFVLRESDLTSIDKVYVNGILRVITTDYTVNLSTGKVTFLTAPIVGQDNVEIHWTKGNGQRSEVLGYTQVMFFGGKNDTRVFLYGNGTNKMHFSDLADGIPSAEYFPPLNYSSVGNSEYPITSVCKQYDRQIIHTTRNAYYSEYEYDDVLGANFPVYPLNDTIGNIPLGQVQLIENNPVTVTTSVYQWVASNVRDERNAVNMSTRVQPKLDELDLSTAITFDYEQIGEYWLCIGKKVFVYNYWNDTWYPFELAHAPTSFLIIDGVLYMGTSDGKIMEWAKYNLDTIPEYLTDDGIIIKSYLETGFMDFGMNYRRKFLNFAWVGLKPESRSLCFVEWESDYDSSGEPEPLYYSLIDFAGTDFADFTFVVNYNPQPFRLKLKAKKFAYLKLIISNESETETMTLLSISLPVSAGGLVK